MTVSDNRTAHPASIYDQAVLKTIPYYDHFHAEAMAWIKAVRSDVTSWLDTGCGTGAMVAKALDAFPQACFTLADPSAEMLRMAEERLTPHRDRIRILPPIGSEALPEALQDSFQVVTAIQSHHYLDQAGRKTAVSKCFDCLSVGGVFITFENVRPDSPWGIGAGKARWKTFQMESGKSELEAQAHLQRFDPEYFPITVDEHLRLFQEIGFRSAEQIWHSCMQAGFLAMK